MDCDLEVHFLLTLSEKSLMLSVRPSVNLDIDNIGYMGYERKVYFFSISYRLTDL